MLRCIGLAAFVCLLGNAPGITATEEQAAPAPAPVTYHAQIEPIVLKDCAPCHQPGESGPFSLLTYDDVRKRAPQIVKVTGSRYMPPWLPEAGYGKFKEERRLTDAQIKLFADWVKQGTPAGTPRKGVEAPRPSS